MRYHYLSVLLIFALSSCGTSSFLGRDGDLKPIYVPPDFPGPITETDGLVTVMPELSSGYLSNPGIGWQDGPEPFGFMYFPETISYSHRRNIGWAILNPEPGKIDWSTLDAQINFAKENGKQFSFRIYTQVGEGFDGHMVPQWVLDQGAVILPNGQPDYSNCVYQEEWGWFVDELRQRYDGNPNIAFIDISGYGNFNEWSWDDDQTDWDEKWEDEYPEDIATSDSITTLDGQARRRLADMFIGGSYDEHSCRATNGEVAQLNYSYSGFTKTQLVLPYAGIVQSTQYVLLRRPDVGFRYDCLGYDGEHVLEKIGFEIQKIWMTAPVVFELCRPDDVDIQDAKLLLYGSHGSIVHNNNWPYSYDELEDLMQPAGYKYFLKEATIQQNSRELLINMKWLNIGSAPNYPQMGQRFEVHFYLVGLSGDLVLNHILSVDTSTWYPADTAEEIPPDHTISEVINLPVNIQTGKYYAGVAIFDVRTGKPINLPFGGLDENGVNILAPVQLVN